MNAHPARQISDTVDVISHSAAQTMRIGQRLGELLRVGDLVLLYGDFGAGKTHLTKGIAQGLGSNDMVNSPSFVLINEYRAGASHGRAPIFHIDLYRLEEPSALAGIGLDEAVDGHGICIIEWAERAQGWVPSDHLAVRMRHMSDTKRALRFEPHGAGALALVQTLKRSAFA